jgi:hypothetical protein
VPLDDVMAVKDAHDRLQQAVSLAFEEAIATIDADAVSTATRNRLPEGQATRDRFVGILLPGMIAVCNPRRVLDRTRSVLALSPWYPSALGGASSAAQGPTDAVVDTAKQIRKAPTRPTPKPASNSEGAPGYMRPLNSNATRTNRPARRQRGAPTASGGREREGGSQGRSMHSKLAHQGWQP